MRQHLTSQDAILAFEAAVLREPGNAEAWRWLGTAHAENDEDKMYSPSYFFFCGYIYH
jgi:hypothetical protein